MAKYIELDALLAEINKRIIDAPINNMGHQRVWAYNDVKNIIETLEMKEVDLEKEIDKYVNTPENQGDPEFKEELSKCALHFANIGWNNGYLKGRKDAHIPARELGLPKAYDFKEEVSEDLEKELSALDNTLFDIDGVAVVGATHYLTVEEVKGIAKHFFELGLNSRKED